jgi:hypothetical protein
VEGVEHVDALAEVLVLLMELVDRLAELLGLVLELLRLLQLVLRLGQRRVHVDDIVPIALHENSDTIHLQHA